MARCCPTIWCKALGTGTRNRRLPLAGELVIRADSLGHVGDIAERAVRRWMDELWVVADSVGKRRTADLEAAAKTCDRPRFFHEA